MDLGMAIAERRLRHVLEHLLDPRRGGRTAIATEDRISGAIVSRSTCFQQGSKNNDDDQQDVVFVPGEFARKAFISSRAEVGFCFHGLPFSCFELKSVRA